MEIICKNGTPTTRNPLNVYEQAQIRLEKIFGHFDNIYVSFSGGKDSGVLLQLCTDYIRKTAAEHVSVTWKDRGG